MRGDDTLKVRAVPTSGAAISGSIPTNATGIQQIGECKAWCLVRFGDLVGWVDRRYLQVEASKATPAAIATSANTIEDCNSDDARKQIKGCSKLIAEGGLGPVELAVAHSRRSDAHLKDRKLDDLIRDRGKALELQPDDAEYKQRLAHAHRLRAAVAIVNSKPEQAKLDYDASIRIDPLNPDSYAGRSEVSFQLQDVDSGIADLKKSVELDATGAFKEQLSAAYVIRSAGHILKKDFDRGIADLSEAIGLEPSNSRHYVHRAMAYHAKGDTGDALKDLTDAIRLTPNDPEAYIRRGELHREQGQFTQAIGDFDEAIKHDSKNATTLLMRALTREEVGQRNEAISDYLATLKIEPANEMAKSSLTRLGSTAAAMARSAASPDAAKTSAAPAALTKEPAPLSFVGRWYGEIKGLNDKRIGDNRTLIISRISADGTVAGRWANSGGNGGEGTGFSLSGTTLVVMTTYNNRVALRHTSPNRLVGTFTNTKSGTRHPIYMERK